MSNLKVLLFGLLTLLSLAQVNSEQKRVLFFAPWISKSIRFKVMPLVEGLADNGHEVVLMMPFCDDCGKHENITVINVKEYDDEFSDEATNSFVDPDLTLFQYSKLYLFMIEGLASAIDNAIGNPDLISEVNKGLDAFIMFNPSACPELMASYLAEKANASLIYFATAQGPGSRLSHLIGQPYNPAYMIQSLQIIPFDKLSTFFDRVVNTLATVLNEILSQYYLPAYEKVLDRHFPGEVRTPLDKLSKEASLVLHTGHPLIDGVRPTVPNFQQVGLLHCRPGKPLPAEFEDFMRKSTDKGVILVSFGTFAGKDGIPESIRLLMVDAFSKLKQNVLWKWDGPDMKDLPPNVRLTKWVPQQDILSHPATKLFISHVGQSSVQEALYHGTPVVAIPLAFDQPFYGQRIETLGAGKSLRYSELTSKKLYDATVEVLDDTKYAENAQKYSAILKDDLISPLDKAIWSVEYAMRHKENHYRSPVHDLEWYQYFLLDVIFFVLFLFVCLVVITYASCRIILFRCVFRKDSNQRDRQKKVN